MSDLVERLRDDMWEDRPIGRLMLEAADRIEELEARVEGLQDEVDGLKSRPHGRIREHGQA